ncbi:MAG: ribonuclease H [Bacteroidales bacterium]
MKEHAFYSMEITEKSENFFKIKINSGELECFIEYNPLIKEIRFHQTNELSKILLLNLYQLRKILHNKRPETFFPGFNLKFILKNNADAIAFNDLNQLIVLDRRNGNYFVSCKEKDERQILRVFTDGCYLEKLKKGAWIALIKSKVGLLNLHFGKTNEATSSLIELMAVIGGLKHCPGTDAVRISTDSRYVIKGLTEWVFNWKLNDWQTAQGKKVKNIEFWMELDKLTENRYIEFEWIKGHSNHFENSICDYYAKLAARSEKIPVIT